MFPSKTIFVLGAGASNEVDLPLGSGLAKTISEKVGIRFNEIGAPLPGGDFSLYNALKAKFRSEVGEYQKAGWTIYEGVLLANSIDDFLDRHASNPRVVQYGKLAIVASILEKEHASRIFTSNVRPRDHQFISSTTETWYPRLLKLLGTGVSVERLDHLFENVAFIDFNYDRCLPHYLIEASCPAMSGASVFTPAPRGVHRTPDRPVTSQTRVENASISRRAPSQNSQCWSKCTRRDAIFCFTVVAAATG
jgi:hypothetical protein